VHCCTCGSCDPGEPCGPGLCTLSRAHAGVKRRVVHASMLSLPTGLREVRGHGSSIEEREISVKETHTRKQHIHDIPYTVYTIIRYYALQYLLITSTLTFIRCGRSAYLCQAPFTAACSRRQSSSSLTLDFLHFTSVQLNIINEG
jgi:hypothetical protein